MSDMVVQLAGVELDHPLMNAAGTCKTWQQMRDFCRAPISAVVVGSVTIHERAGNPGQTYWSGGLNALGLPNPGLDYYVKHLPGMLEVARQGGKPLIVSVAGFNPDEYVRLAEHMARAGVDLVEFNFGCPNVRSGGVQHRIMSFDPSTMRAVLDRSVAVLGSTPFGVKLSPYSDPYLLDDVASMLSDLPVGYVAACNTFPNAVAYQQGHPVIDGQYGGLSGPAMLQIAVGQVAQFRAKLPDRIGVVGVGGVTTGAAIDQHLRAGAVAVQAAHAYWSREGNLAAYAILLQQWADRHPDVTASTP